MAPVARMTCKFVKHSIFLIQNSQGDVKYSIEDTVNNIAIIMYGARLILELLEGSLCRLGNCLTTMLYT